MIGLSFGHIVSIPAIILTIKIAFVSKITYLYPRLHIECIAHLIHFAHVSLSDPNLWTPFMHVHSSLPWSFLLIQPTPFWCRSFIQLGGGGFHLWCGLPQVAVLATVFPSSFLFNHFLCPPMLCWLHLALSNQFFWTWSHFYSSTFSKAAKEPGDHVLFQ